MIRKINYNKSGSGSITGRVIIPQIMLEALKLTPEDKEIDIYLEDGKIIIEKIIQED